MEETVNRIEILISRILSGNATSEEINELNAWKEESEKNLKLFEKYKKIWDTNNNWLSEEEVRSDYSKINTQLLQKLSVHNRRSTIINWIYKAAAILLIPVLIAFGWYYIKYSDNSSKQYTEITSPNGQISKCTLIDGTEVWLNSGSTIKYNTLFNKGTRDIALDGEAYFKVAKNKLKPFIVKAKNLKVKVHGTSFNVAAYKNSNIVETILEEGSVEIFFNEKSKQSIFIESGERAIYDLQNNHVNIEQVETSLHTAWRDGKFLFKDADLLTILKELERIYDVKIELENESIGNIHLRGMFEYNHNIVDALYKIEKTTNLKYQIEGRIVRINYK